MDLKDSKTQKIALAAMAFFIVVFFWYSRVYSRYDSEISLRMQEFETITTNLRNVEMKAKSLDALKREYEGLIVRYHEIETLLPEVQQIPSFLVQLHTASSITGTKIRKLHPAEVASVDFYNVASFRVEMTGRYHDFGKFISYVANFPFITNVSDVKLTASRLAVTAPSTGNNRNSPEDRETITAVFDLSTYFVKEEERLKELAL